MDRWARQAELAFSDPAAGEAVLVQHVFWFLGQLEPLVGLGIFAGVLLCTAAVAIMFWRRTEAGYQASAFAFMAFGVTLALLGFAGWAQANRSIDTALHDTYYVVGHFHLTFLAGAGLLFLAVVYAGLTALFALAFRLRLAMLQVALFTCGVWLVSFVPLIFLNHAMPRRYVDYADGVPVQVQTAQTLVQIGYFATLTSLAVFAICIADAVINRLRTRQGSRPDP